MKKFFYLFLLLSANCVAQTPVNPFPHHTVYAAGTIRPSNFTQANLDLQVKHFYDAWKAKYLLAGCNAPEYYVWYNDDGSEGNAITVSEAIGYGMVIEALMAGYETNAKRYFDGLFYWYVRHPSSVNGSLMDWQQQKDSCKSIGNDAATDGDLDAAFALLLADKQWGSNGSIDYLKAAKKIIAAIKTSEVYNNSKALQLGDWAHTSNKYKDGTRPSDFMYDHLRAFGNVMHDSSWYSVLDECYSLVQNMQTNYSSTTGLIPDFIQKTDSVPVPAAAKYLESKWDGNYYYNSCRVPWHLGCDYVLNGDVRAKNACIKINNWIKKVTGGNSHNIRSGYLLNGNNITGNNYEDQSFIAPFGVSAMESIKYQSWLNNIWSNIISVDDLSRDSYYGNTIKMICMIVMSGNMWAPYSVGFAKQQTGTTQNTNAFISPNPAKGNIILQYQSPKTESVKITIQNTGGNIVYTASQKVIAGQNKINIQLPPNSKGIYMLSINPQNTGTQTKLSFIAAE